MKNLALLFIAMLTIGSSYAAEENTATRRGTVYDGSKYIFVEDGIEFSVFPDGEFDFYIPQLVEGVSLSVNAGPVGISFNTGFDYDPYVQYDEYGAVIQIENTPLYYDNFGRLIQAGSVDINYRNNRIRRVGGLQIFYNNYGAFSHYNGFINVYNRNYVFHPYHNFYYRPIFNRCLVYTTPYRMYYNPIRYDYVYHRNNWNRGYNRGYANARRDFRRPDNGRVAHNNGRRSNVDRNNARFTRAGEGRNASRIASNRTNRDANRRGVATNSRSNRNASADRSRGNTSRENSRRAPRTTEGNRTTNRRGTTNTRPSSRDRNAVTQSRGNRINRETTTRPQSTRTVGRKTTERNSRAVANNGSSRNETRRAPQRSATKGTRSSRPVASNRAPRKEAQRAPERSSQKRSATASNRSSKARSAQPQRSASRKVNSRSTSSRKNTSSKNRDSARKARRG